MAQLIGILIIINSLVVTTWWIGTGRAHSAVFIPVCLIAVFAGIVLIMQDRALEITIKGVGSIKAAAEQAILDAKQVTEIKDQIVAQRATIDIVAKLRILSGFLRSWLSRTLKLTKSLKPLIKNSKRSPVRPAIRLTSYRLSSLVPQRR